MGYAVLHLEKAKGADGAMSTHIERTVHPKNADRMRTHLNRELVRFPEGVKNRTQAIAHRIETAGIKRKVGTNQVKAIRVLLTGSNKDMKQMEEDGRLDGWCNDNLKWLRETYGERNLVSAVLHMDEKTPHIHATIVPIVTGERRKARKVFVCATFGLFTGGLTKFDEYYEKGIIDRILTTNLVYQTPDMLDRPY